MVVRRAVVLKVQPPGKEVCGHHFKIPGIVVVFQFIGGGKKHHLVTIFFTQEFGQ